MNRDYKFPHLVTIWRPIGVRDMFNQFEGFEVTVKKCRYEPSFRLYTNEAGQHIRSNAYVYTINADIKLGDIVIKGDHSYSDTPVDGAFEVKQDISSSNLRGDRTEYKYIL